MPLILVAALSAAFIPVSMECGNLASVETMTVVGPAGITAKLRISSSDDHVKDYHGCLAKFELIVSRGSAAPPVTHSLGGYDADWGRHLTAHLTGFSKDGKRLFAIFSEDGKDPLTELIDYYPQDGTWNQIDLTKDLRALGALACSQRFAVIGTTDAEDIVLEQAASKGCVRVRWLLGARDWKLRPITPETRVLTLHGRETGNPRSQLMARR
jgi:hypothetical protein